MSAGTHLSHTGLPLYVSNAFLRAAGSSRRAPNTILALGS